MLPKLLCRMLIAALLVMLGCSSGSPATAEPVPVLGSAERPLILPADTETLISSKSAEPSAWIRIPVMEVEGKIRPVLKAISVVQRSHLAGTPLGADELRAVRFSAVQYEDSQGERHTLDISKFSTGGRIPDDAVTGVGFDEIESAAVAKGLSAPAWGSPFKLTYQQLDKDGKPVGTRNPVLVSWRLSTDLGDSIDPLMVGPASIVWRANKRYQSASDFAAERGLKPSDFATPDLFVSFDGRPQTGELCFVPLGQFEFASLPKIVRVFNSAGDDLLASGALKIGKALLSSHGELQIPFETVSPEVTDMVVIARGVQIFIFPDASDASVHCYSVGGRVVARACADKAAVADGKRLLDNWDSASAQQQPDLGAYQVPTWDENSKGVISKLLGDDLPRASLRGENGFLTGITIFDSYYPSMKVGSVVLRPIWGWRFITDANTTLYVATWSGGSGLDLSDEVEASMTVNSTGAIEIDLTKVPVGAVSGLNLVLVNPRIEVTAKLTYGDLLQLNVYGGAVPDACRKNFVLQRTIDSTAADTASPGLPGKAPVQVRDWKPVASLK